MPRGPPHPVLLVESDCGQKQRLRVIRGLGKDGLQQAFRLCIAALLEKKIKMLPLLGIHGMPGRWVEGARRRRLFPDAQILHDLIVKSVLVRVERIIPCAFEPRCGGRLQIARGFRQQLCGDGDDAALFHR